MRRIAGLLYQERARVIIEYFKPQFKTMKDFTEYCHLKDRAPYDWKYLSDEEREKKIGDRDDSSVQEKNRTNLCKYLKLKETIWVDKFISIEDMKNKFEDYRKKIDFSEFIHIDNFKTTKEEENLLINHKQNKKLLLKKKLFDLYSTEFLFKLANIYLKNNFAREALEIIDYIETVNSDFKYIYQKEIKHFKALCYSHNSIKDWESAIHLLREMYFDDSYIDNIETLTLLASNYKRKALSSKQKDNMWCNINEIDEALLLESMRFYHRIYWQKKIDNYYDGINLYYLGKISDEINMWNKSNSDKKIYDEIAKHARKNFNPKSNNWWESITKIEFLMLDGNTKEAISDFNMLYDNIDIKPFEIDATIRQIEMYTHFVDDKSAKKVLQVLKDARESISE